MQNQLEWSVLDVDEEEWQQRSGSPEPAAAANGFPVHEAVPQKRCFTRGAAVAAAAVLLLVAILGFGAWYKAEQGLNRMEQEVANVIKMDTIQAHSEQHGQREQTTVQGVEFLDGKAMVRAVVTHTLPTGRESVVLQTQFYSQTPRGWQRTVPVVAFWGSAQELDTPNLHFVFRQADRAAVEQLAHKLDALYTVLRSALGQNSSGADGGLTVEVLPTHVPPKERFTAGRLKLTSPLLNAVAFGDTAADQLGRQARQILVAEMMDQTLGALPIKDQWQPLVDKLRTWLHYSDMLPLAPPPNTNPLPVITGPVYSLRLTNLLGCSPCADSDLAIGAYGKKDSAAIMSLFDFIAVTYGLDVLPALLAGFGRYDDWDTLAPAVFGCSAGELETAWRAWMITHRPT